MTIRACAALVLVAGGLTGAASADIQTYLVGYQLNSRQTSPTHADLVSAVFFNAVNGLPGEAASATMTSGLTGTSYDLIEVVPGVFQGGSVFTDPSDMFTEFAPGDTFTLAVDGGTLGAQSGDVTTPDPLNFPDVGPMFDAGQYPQYDAIDGLSDYTFRFNTFTSSGNLEQVYLEISAYPSTRRVFLGITSADAGRLTVPAGTMRLNRRFTATLYFLSYVETPAAGFVSATSNVRSRPLRSAIASGSVRKPTPCSARPGIGSSRDTDPSATTRWS